MEQMNLEPTAEQQEQPLDLSLPKRQARREEKPNQPKAHEEIPDGDGYSEHNRYFLGDDFVTLDSLPEQQADSSDKENDEGGWGLTPQQVLAAKATDTRPRQDRGTEDAPWNQEGPDHAAARELRRQGGSKLKSPPAWMQKRRGFSGTIIHDGDLTEWSRVEAKFAVIHHKEPTVKNWTRYIKSGHIRFRGRKVILCLRLLKNYASVSQLKNALSSLGHAIRQAAGQEQVIYVCDSLIVKGADRGLMVKTTHYNQLLEEALRSIRISHKMEKVFLVEMSRHFRQENLPRNEEPDKCHQLDRYVQLEGKLTKLGCMHYRAQLFKELGLASYN